MIESPRLILASTSPRRQELLALLGLPFEIIGSGFDEDSISTEGFTPGEWVSALATGKATEVARRTSGNALVLGADTTVILEGDYLNKPRDADEAKQMLRRLSGRTHQVYTGLCLLPVTTSLLGEPTTISVVTDVTFDTISDATIAAYVATGEPLDKAGAYGIQGKALAFIPEIRGDYFNVMGLPVEFLRGLLLPHYPHLAPAPPQPRFPTENHGDFLWITA